VACIWYVSKYVAPPAKARAGGRGYLIMREMARMGHECVIITSNSNQLAEVPQMDEPYRLQQVDGLQLWWVNTLKYQVAKSLRRILSWLDFEWRLWRMPKATLPRPDAIIVSSLSLLTIINGFFLRQRYRARLVFEIRDIWPLTITEEGGFSARNPLVLGMGWIEKWGYRSADEVVGTMPNLGEHVAEVLGFRRPTHCIPMGVAEDTFVESESLADGYAEKYIPKEKFIVAHVGSIGIANALDTLLDCAQVMNYNQNVHFLVVGEGDLRAGYEKRYAHLSNLTFAPRVPKTMVQALLRRCDLLYFSAHASKRWRFGQSLNKLIDYMLAGKPVVASYSGFPSMINEANCGSFVPAGDVQALRQEFERYLRMPNSLREAIGKRGRDWLLANRQYSKLAQDYQSILLKRAESL